MFANLLSAVDWTLIIAIALTVLAACLLVLFIIMGVSSRKSEKAKAEAEKKRLLNGGDNAEPQKISEEPAPVNDDKREGSEKEDEPAEENEPEKLGEEPSASIEGQTQEPAEESKQPEPSEEETQDAAVESEGSVEQEEKEPENDRAEIAEDTANSEEISEPEDEKKDEESDLSAEESAEEEVRERSAFSAPVQEQASAAEETAPVKEEPSEKPKEKVPDETASAKDKNNEQAAPVTGSEARYRYRLSFRGKMVQAGENAQTLEGKAEDELNSYSALNSVESWTKIRFREGKRNTVAYLLFRNKVLCIAFALDPSAVSAEQYGAADMSQVKRFRKTPILLELTDDASLENAKKLIAIAVSAYGTEKAEVKERNYVLPYEDAETLVEKGMAKKRLYVPRPRKKKEQA